MDSPAQGKRIVALLLSIGLLYAARFTGRAAYADILAVQGLGGLKRAAELQPNNAEYWERLSLPLPIPSPEYTLNLKNAARNDSHNRRLWMKLGDAAAINGDNEKAEKAYLELAKYDRGYDPHWRLANLYFREGNAAKFWNQIGETLAFDTRDLGAAFELCWAMTPNPQELLNGLPKNPKILARYLEYLSGTNRMPEAAQAAESLLAASPTKNQHPTLISYCERLLADKRNHDAAKIWTALHPAATDNLLVNAQMLDPFTGRGFDWRWDAPGNVGHIQIPSLSQVEFQFDGNQPEKCELLSQPLALAPGSAYRFTFDYRSLDITGHSGLRWQIKDVDSGEILVSEEMASPSWKSSVMLFRVPPVSRGQRLVLSYERPRGTTRISGSLAVRAPVLKRVE